MFLRLECFAHQCFRFWSNLDFQIKMCNLWYSHVLEIILIFSWDLEMWNLGWIATIFIKDNLVHYYGLFLLNNFFSAVLEFELRALHSGWRHSTSWATFFPGQPGLCFSYFTLPTVAGMTATHPAFFPLGWKLFAWNHDPLDLSLLSSWGWQVCTTAPNFSLRCGLCPGWPQTTVLLISASKVVRIIGVSHWHQLIILFYTQVFIHYR
jgi:hypothetical protein